MFIVKLFQYIK